MEPNNNNSNNTNNNSNDDNNIDHINIANLLDEPSGKFEENNNKNKTTSTSNTGKNSDTPVKEEEGGNSFDNNQEGQDNDIQVPIQDLLKSFNTDPSNTEHKEIKEGLLKEFKGTQFDEQGNIIDENNNIVKSFEDILEYLNEDDVQLDDKGNQIDDKGQIIKTKEQLDQEKLEASSVVNKLHLTSDYEFLDENDRPKVYSDDDKGFEEFANDLANARLEEYKRDFFTQNPELREVAKHLLTGGTIDNFRNTIDYNKVDVKSLSKDEKLGFIRESYEIAGFNKERIDRLVQVSVDSNNVDKDAADALSQLSDHKATLEQERDIKLQRQLQEENAKVDQYWNSVEEAITKGNLGFANIPNEEKADFFDYLSSAVDNKGNSKEMLDRQKETVEQKVALAYLRYKGFDLSKLVNNKAQTLRVSSLKERIAKAAKIDYSSGGGNKKGKSTSTTLPTIDELLS